jgi:hypothetical protein
MGINYGKDTLMQSTSCLRGRSSQMTCEEFAKEAAQGKKELAD